MRKPLRQAAGFIVRSAAVLTLVGGFANAQSSSPSGSFGFLINSAFKSSATATGMAFLGLINFDGAGNVTGTYTYEVDARSSMPVKTTRGSLTGTYSSNADGTGSATIALDAGINLTFAMVSAESGQSLRLAVTNYQFPSNCFCIVSGMSLSGTARATSGGALSGSYASLSNNVPNVNSSVGVLKFDGAGNVVFTETFVGSSDDSGQPATPDSGSQRGTYTVNPDGTGTINLSEVPNVSNARSFAFVVTDNGLGIFFVQLDRAGSGVLTGTARMQ